MALEPDDTLDEADFDEAFGQADSPPIAIPLMPPPQAQPQMQQRPPQAQPQMQQRPPQMQQPQMQQRPPQMQQQRPPQMQQQRPPQMQQQRPMSQPQQRLMPQPQRQMAPYQPPFALPLPPGLGQAVPEEGFLTRKVGGLPVWAWGLIVAGGGTVAYFTMREKKDDKKKKIEKNLGSAESVKRLGSGERSSGSWSPSRGTFCTALEKKFGGKFEKVYDDADDAKNSFKTVSPLINVKAKSGYQIDRTFEAFCKSYGLHPVMHDDNEIGLYPADGTAKGRAWEEYVDLLRDDGQTV
jgi:hypothetical protein